MSLGAPALNTHKVCLEFPARRNVYVITVQLCLLNKNPLRHYVYAQSETLNSYIHVHRNICVGFLFPQNICTQYGVNFIFITHVEKCILWLNCYANRDQLKNNEFCTTLLWSSADTLNTMNAYLIWSHNCVEINCWTVCHPLQVNLNAVTKHHYKYTTHKVTS